MLRGRAQQRLGNRPVPERLPAEALLARIFDVFLGLGLALVIVGSGIEITRTGGLPEETIPVSELLRRLLEGNGDAMLTLGILVFLAGPMLGVLALVVSALRQGDRRTGLLAMLLLIIVASAPLLRAVGGG
jgi:uncharacterized membrane protein